MSCTYVRRYVMNSKVCARYDAKCELRLPSTLRVLRSNKGRLIYQCPLVPATSFRLRPRRSNAERILRMNDGLLTDGAGTFRSLEGLAACADADADAAVADAAVEPAATDDGPTSSASSADVIL
jgi:hypothetical protein